LNNYKPNIQGVQRVRRWATNSNLDCPITRKSSCLSSVQNIPLYYIPTLCVTGCEIVVVDHLTEIKELITCTL